MLAKIRERMIPFNELITAVDHMHEKLTRDVAIKMTDNLIDPKKYIPYKKSLELLNRVGIIGIDVDHKRLSIKLLRSLFIMEGVLSRHFKQTLSFSKDIRLIENIRREIYRHGTK